MGRCGGCGSELGEGVLSCPSCGDTLLPPHAERSLQTVFQQGDLLAERFRVEKILGTGASGVVYGVCDLRLDSRCALKVLWERADPGDPIFERLRREILTSQKARHDGLISIHDLLFIHDHPALVMEWVEGTTLRDRIRTSGPLPVDEALAVARALLAALRHLHSLGIVHRDVKSGNILLGKDGSIKLGDFGLAKGPDAGVSLTATGAVLGTPGFMAPEVIQGGAATHVSDLYSLGVVLFEMLTGRTPFAGTSALEVASRQLQAPPPLALLKENKVPRWLVKVVARLLERYPGDRFPTAEAVLSALNSRAPGFAVAKRWKRRLAACFGILLIAVGLGALRIWQLREQPLAITFHDKVLEVRDAKGKHLWSKPLDREIQAVHYGHFGPGGRGAVACVVKWGYNSEASTVSEEGIDKANRLVILDRSGVILRDQPLSFPVPTSFAPHLVPLLLTSHRFANGEPVRLVVMAQHYLWYPCMVKVLPPVLEGFGEAKDSDRSSVFYNSGFMQKPLFSDIDGDGRDEIITWGINNRLYHQVFVAACPSLISQGLNTRISTSPDIGHASATAPVFYRLLDSVEYGRLELNRAPGKALLKISEEGIPRYSVSPRGEIAAGAAGPQPMAKTVAAFNLRLPELCSLRDEGRYDALLKAASALPQVDGGPYGWLGRFFRVDALLGMGRHSEADAILEEGRRTAQNAPLPTFYHRFSVDSAFLAGRYQDCISRFLAAPSGLRKSKPELGGTALWAAVYAGDDATVHYLLKDGSAFLMPWVPRLQRGIQAFFRGDYPAAAELFRSLNRYEEDSLTPGLWLVEAQIRMGAIREARDTMDRLIRDHPGENLAESKEGIWLRWNEGDHSPGLLAAMDALLAHKRKSALGNVEARALLPLTLSRCAAMHLRRGERALGSELRAEAVRLAPAGWRAHLTREADISPGPRPS